MSRKWDKSRAICGLPDYYQSSEKVQNEMSTSQYLCISKQCAYGNMHSTKLLLEYRDIQANNVSFHLEKVEKEWSKREAIGKKQYSWWQKIN